MNKKAISRIAVAAAAGALMAGCAAPQNPDPRDPWEGFNRGIYKFNDTVDRAVFKPVAQAYTFVTPEPVRSCVHNIFSNVGDLWSGTNSFLQGRGHDFVNTLGRFLFNTTMGVGGCFDVASANGARRIPNDFGTTLGVWGLGQGPYLVLPFFGSSTVRDGAGLVGDYAGTTYGYMGVDAIDNVRLRNSLWGLRVVDTRASLLDATDTVDRVALDPYSFVRDAYLQRRAAMVLGHKVDDESSLPNYEDDEDDAAPAAPADADLVAVQDARVARRHRRHQIGVVVGALADLFLRVRIGQAVASEMIDRRLAARARARVAAARRPQRGHHEVGHRHPQAGVPAFAQPVGQADVVGVHVGDQHAQHGQAFQLVLEDLFPQGLDLVARDAAVDDGPAVPAVDVVAQ